MLSRLTIVHTYAYPSPFENPHLPEYKPLQVSETFLRAPALLKIDMNIGQITTFFFRNGDKIRKNR